MLFFLSPSTFKSDRLLAEHFLKRIAVEYGKKTVPLEQKAALHLQTCHWPGNGRELLHVLERAAFSSTGNGITLADLPVYGVLPVSATRRSLPAKSLKQQMHAAERQAIVAALIQAGNNKTVAARMLGIHRTLLYRKMKQLNVCDPMLEKREKEK
jgi:DNA-binding NtrC family response regulator